jgi:hypothetical protein
MKISNNAMILDEKLPDSEKDKNSHLNDLRKDPHVKDFFEGKNPNISDLPELNQALKQARKDKIDALSEVIKDAKDESSTNSIRGKSGSSLSEKVLTENTFKENYSKNSDNKEDYSNDSDYKLGNSLLDYIIEILKNFF